MKASRGRRTELVVAGLAMALVIASRAYGLTITFDIGTSFVSAHTVANPTQVSVNLTQVGPDLFVGQDTSVTLANGTVVQINNISFAPDPVLTFGINTTNATGAPLSIAVSTFVPIPGGPLHGLVSLKSDLSGSFSDGESNGGTVTQLAVAPTIAQFDLNGLVLTPPTVPNMDVGTTHTYPGGGASQFNFGTALGSFDCDSLVGGCITFSTAIGYTMNPAPDAVTPPDTAFNDNFGFSSRFEINPVPEPVSLVLLGTGLIGVAVNRRLRRRA